MFRPSNPTDICFLIRQRTDKIDNTTVVNTVISKCVNGMPQNTKLSHSLAAYSITWEPVLHFNVGIILPSIYIFSSPFHSDWPAHQPINHRICGYGSKTARTWNCHITFIKNITPSCINPLKPTCFIILELSMLSTQCGSHNKQCFPKQH
jgi:hypothetical protein